MHFIRIINKLYDFVTEALCGSVFRSYIKYCIYRIWPRLVRSIEYECIGHTELKQASPYRKHKTAAKKQESIYYILYIFWAHRWYTRLSHRLTKLSDVLWSAMAILTVDDGSYGWCSAVFNWIFRYCCQLNLLNRSYFMQDAPRM